MVCTVRCSVVISGRIIACIARQYKSISLIFKVRFLRQDGLLNFKSVYQGLYSFAATFEAGGEFVGKNSVIHA